MTDHTPGPWRINGGRIEVPGWGGTVAVVGEINNQSQLDTANARLIAAAPDLLAALQAVRAFIGYEAYVPELIEQAAGAIAKATGND